MTRPRRGIILLEGPDCSGKTTLARHLVNEHGARYIHCRRDKNIWRLQTGALRLAARWAEKGLVVLDRHWISECIYGKVFRGSSAFPHSARSIRRMLDRFGTLTVLCVPPAEFVVENHAKRAKAGGEMYDSIREVATRYQDLLLGSIMRPVEGDHVEELSGRGGIVDTPGWAHYDLAWVTKTRNPQATMANEAKRLLERLDEVTEGIRPFFWNITLQNLAGRVSYSDRDQPLTVLIGDRASDPRCAVTWPFYSNTGASVHLNKQLQLAGIPEERLALVNGWDPGGLITLEAVHKMRPLARFVALGEKAAASVKGTNIKLAMQLRHPQHARRFTHNDNSYREELTRAVFGS